MIWFVFSVEIYYKMPFHVENVKRIFVEIVLMSIRDILEPTLVLKVAAKVLTVV